MDIKEELAKVSPGRDTVLTIGVFDGVHLGHQCLLSQVLQHARAGQMLSGVVTFRQHPQEVLSPETKLPRLTSLEQRIALFKKAGIDIIVALTFTKEVARQSVRQFVNLLKEYLRMRKLVVGPDFALGRNREGNADVLRALGREMDFTVTAVPPVMVNGEVVSSSSIRKALTEGDMEKVHRFLGRYFSLGGRVVPGAGRGAALGFPTANLDIGPQQALPPDGIYATRAFLEGKAHQSVTNIGRRPTFDAGGRTVEVYIMDYEGDLYGHDLSVELIQRLRNEVRFSSAEQLKKQIEQDIVQSRALLESWSKD